MALEYVLEYSTADGTNSGCDGAWWCRMGGLFLQALRILYHGTEYSEYLRILLSFMCCETYI